MNAPAYEWVCHSCKGANPAHTGLCAFCGMSANFTMAQLAPAEMRPVDLSLAEGLAIAAGFGLLALTYSIIPPDLRAWIDWRLPTALIVIVLMCIWAACKKVFSFIVGRTTRR